MTTPRILDDLQAKRLEAQRRLASSCAPEDSRPAVRRPIPQAMSSLPNVDLTDAGFRVFVADARDAFVKFDPVKKRAETKDEAFARRWQELMPLRREHYCRLAAAALGRH